MFDTLCLQGWDTGVVGMKKGGKRFLVVPPGMAYGSQGMGNKVPANSTLLFEVEVVRVSLSLLYHGNIWLLINKASSYRKHFKFIGIKFNSNRMFYFISIIFVKL